MPMNILMKNFKIDGGLLKIKNYYIWYRYCWELYNYFELDSSYKVKVLKIKVYKKTFLGLPVYALKILKKCKPNEYEAFVAVGYTNLNSLRKKI